MLDASSAQRVAPDVTTTDEAGSAIIEMATLADEKPVVVNLVAAPLMSKDIEETTVDAKMLFPVEERMHPP
jgi:hypothetical protein